MGLRLRPGWVPAGHFRAAVLVVAVMFCALFGASTALASVYTVNSAADTDDGVCDLVSCTLREALNASNIGAGADTITFQVGAGGGFTISPASPLPPIAGQVFIDGTSQTGFAGTPLVEINGAAAGDGVNGLDVQAGGTATTIAGLIVNGFAAGGIALQSGSSAVTIAGNWIGVDPSGTLAKGNLIGVLLDGSTANTIGGASGGTRNVISGNQTAVSITGVASKTNTILGNYIGVTAAGDAAVGTGTGIAVTGGASDNAIGTAGNGNVISGGSQDAIFLSTTTGNVVKGNLIGTDAAGVAVFGNDISVHLGDNADGNQIGSVGAGANVMAGNADVAVLLSGADGNTIDGNFIGTDLGGDPFATLNEDGVRILSGTGNTFSSNRISSSHGSGIELDGGANAVTGNDIDLNTGGGIVVNAGGSTIGPNNTIRDNIGSGVRVALGTGTKITGNSISGNAAAGPVGLGIDLGGDGVTTNDPGDDDPGANNLQNYPVITSAVAGNSTTTIQGTLDTVVPGTYRVEYFFSPACDPSGFGEGKTYLGFLDVDIPSANEELLIDHPAVLAAGNVVTMTATAADGSTSESRSARRSRTRRRSSRSTRPPTTTTAPATRRTARCARRSWPSTRRPRAARSPSRSTRPAHSRSRPRRRCRRSRSRSSSTGRPSSRTRPRPASHRRRRETARSSSTAPSRGRWTGSSSPSARAGRRSAASTSRTSATSRRGPQRESGCCRTPTRSRSSFVGTSSNGIDLQPNDIGIAVTGESNAIGRAGAGNLVSGNRSYGILVDGTAGGAEDNVVAGNFVGTTRTGNAPLADDIGIAAYDAPRTTIGGLTVSDGNVVHGASTGIDVTGRSAR